MSEGNVAGGFVLGAFFVGLIWLLVAICGNIDSTNYVQEYCELKGFDNYDSEYVEGVSHYYCYNKVLAEDGVGFVSVKSSYFDGEFAKLQFLKLVPQVEQEATCGLCN